MLLVEERIVQMISNSEIVSNNLLKMIHEHIKLEQSNPIVALKLKDTKNQIECV